MSETCIYYGDPIVPETEGDTDTCDACWYGMRMDPEHWKREHLAPRGRTAQKGPGCVPFGEPGGMTGWLCMSPYLPEEESV